MSFGGYNDLIGRYSVFKKQKTGFSKRAIVDEIESHSNQIQTDLRETFSTFPVQATGAIVASGNVNEDEEVRLGSSVYRFKATPEKEYDIDIGSDVEESMLNLDSAIEDDEFGAYHDDTDVNTDAESSQTGQNLVLTARKAGMCGNRLPLSTTAVNLTVTAFSGGLNEVPVLTSLSLWKTVISLLGGKAISAESGAGNKPLLTRVEKQIIKAEKTLEKALYLITKTGEIKADSMCPEATAVSYDE